MLLSDIPAMRCFTCVGWTVYKGRTLLVKHKKLGIWLAPGGHIDENELPHQCAEREFFEETGVKVKAVSASPIPQGEASEYLPLPFIANLHWIKKPRGDSFCEQHYGYGFFVQVLDTSQFGRQLEETDDIGWFTKDEALGVLTSDLAKEAQLAFERFPVSSQ